jgi:glutathione-independent formaldehyde dehydrogenase
MKGLVYLGPREGRIDDVADAKLEKETDALVRVTSTNICGSDLHMYEGRTSVEKGKVLGHENLGQVIAVGKAVDPVKVGEWVCFPFNIGCGFCENCEAGLPSACLRRPTLLQSGQSEATSGNLWLENLTWCSECPSGSGADGSHRRDPD